MINSRIDNISSYIIICVKTVQVGGIHLPVRIKPFLYTSLLSAILICTTVVDDKAGEPPGTHSHRATYHKHYIPDARLTESYLESCMGFVGAVLVLIYVRFPLVLICFLHDMLDTVPSMNNRETVIAVEDTVGSHLRQGFKQMKCNTIWALFRIFLL